MNQGFLTLLGRLVFASASLVIIQTAANAQESRLSAVSGQIAEKSNQEQRISQNPAAYQLILAQKPTRRQRVINNNAPVPEAVSNAVIQNLSQQTGIEASALKIVAAEQQTWANGCLGISSPGVPCAEGKVPGWEVVVGSATQRWVYRSNMSGSLVKLDAIATQNFANRPATSTETAESAATSTPAQTTPTTRTSQGTATRTQRQTTTNVRRQTAAPTEGQTTTSASRQTTQTTTQISTPQRTVTRTQRQSTTTMSRQTPAKGTGEFTLAIWQPAANLSEVVARISAMSKDSNYARERYIGDYRYQVNQRAKFVGGVNPGDRIVVRLYNYQNRLIGFTEFEVLPQKSSVNIILGNRPIVSRIVRTVYGVDVDENAAIDAGATTYDFYTNITGPTPSQETVVFLRDTQGIDQTWYQVAGLPVPPETGAFSSAVRAMEAQQITIFPADLPPVLTAVPGSQKPVVNVAANNQSTFNLNSQTAASSTQSTTATTSPTTEQTRVNTQSTNTEVQASFPDVPTNYWARNFIGRLAEKGVIQGYPDGLYRPTASLTRAEFAIIITGAFNQDKEREVVAFKDVATNFWAYPAIREAYEMGFLDADSRGNFRPDEKITRLDVLVALAKGLNYAPTVATERTLRVYTDGASIPKSDRTLVAAVTERNIVVNYPYVRTLNPQRAATRAEVAALIYRALVSTGEVADISSPYVVSETTIQRRQTTPTRKPTNNNSGRQTQSLRHSNTSHSGNTSSTRRTTTVETSNTNRTRRTPTVKRSTNSSTSSNSSGNSGS
ncbi:S-layer homology domain-containing protein [Phormidium sp. LEGE 05292]|uniref:S-layer homology domain-containing protein n=1 Tax=[Phormidium] sp. LEGE 05292 TaxID=767427 RepID=UPI0018822EBC|nr:S-layer homology domain-containing protein [Phormidium sp. LEGE 05292]MBE9229471.1 S-layer homology domain-containing protein [Phormidium sp. LEGE 05292]